MKMLVQSAGRALLRCINRPLTVSRAVQRTCAYQTSTIHLQEQATEARHSSQQHHKQQFKEEAPKTTTAVTGLPVDINWRDTLSELYHKTLEEVKIMPEHVYYRQAVEAITRYRLNLIQDPSLNRDDVEETMNCQVEQLIEMAKDELELIPQYASWRAWEEEDEPLEDEDYHDLYESLREIDPAKMDANNIEWPPNEGREAEFQSLYETEHQKEERRRKEEEEARQKEAEKKKS
eukprot:gb/GECG01011388.1/.p1 GENE.gb/GECG01011388.1/~~gb/GECG01011388.1/.p1  ORF type:complete len:234 (+),score=44.91 gb/GECG01011388.1/:1-702(+)